MHLAPPLQKNIYLINVEELEFGKRIGSGAFGEVFIGKVDWLVEKEVIFSSGEALK